MKRLEAALADIAPSRNGTRRKPALMTHVVLGYPTLAKSIDIVKAMDAAGASFVELQIPFSDPMADGPTIMAANEAALAGGIKVRDSFRAAERLAKQVSVPLLFMSYYNILFRYPGSGARNGSGGTAAFCRDAAQSGIQGLIIPDVPAGGGEEYWAIAERAKLAAIPIVSPVSTESRLRAIQGIPPRGFVYCVSTTGTTGARKALPADLHRYLARIRTHFSLPLAVGFGISSREHVLALSGKAEIAIVGSAVIDVIRKTPPKDVTKRVSAFVADLTA